MQKIRKKSLKDILKNIEHKSEAEKTQLIWLMSGFSMVLIFCLWLAGAWTNFARLSDSSTFDLSILPEFPHIETAGLEETFRQGGKAMEDLEKADEATWRSEGDKYVERKGILADEDFSTLRIAEIRSEGGNVVLKYEHYYKEVLVLDSILVLVANGETREVSERENSLKSGTVLAVDPVISAKEAALIAQKELENDSYAFSSAKLVVVFQSGKPYLVWNVLLRSGEDEKNILVGASRGSIINYDFENNQTSDMAE